MSLSDTAQLEFAAQILEVPRTETGYRNQLNALSLGEIKPDDNDPIAIETARAQVDFLPEQETITRELQRRMRQAIKILTPEEQLLLKLRYGIGCERHTLDEIAEQFKLEKNDIRNMEARAFRKIKNSELRRPLATFLPCN